MKVRRIYPWLRHDGSAVAVGEMCEMPESLALLHIAHGSAEPVAEPEAPSAPAEPPPVAEPEAPSAPAEPHRRRR